MLIGLKMKRDLKKVWICSCWVAILINNVAGIRMIYVFPLSEDASRKQKSKV